MDTILQLIVHPFANAVGQNVHLMNDNACPHTARILTNSLGNEGNKFHHGQHNPRPESDWAYVGHVNTELLHIMDNIHNEFQFFDSEVGTFT